MGEGRSKVQNLKSKVPPSTLNPRPLFPVPWLVVSWSRGLCWLGFCLSKAALGSGTDLMRAASKVEGRGSRVGGGARGEGRGARGEGGSLASGLWTVDFIRV